MSINKVILIGNTTKDPELTTSSTGMSICKFSLAVGRKTTNAEGERETDFLNIVIFKNQADICHKYLRKGSKVGVVGRIQTGSYTAQDGTKRYTTAIVADEVEFLNTKTQEKTEKPKTEEPKLEPIDDDNLPF